MFSYIKHHLGFTLAEVLTTLMVIGIVAALTIPNLANAYKEQSNIAKMKKAAATYANFVTMFLQEEGIENEVEAADIWNENYNCNFIFKHFKSIKVIDETYTCTFSTPDGIIWDFTVLTMDDKTYSQALITKVYLPDEQDIKIQGKPVTFKDGATTNFFYFYFHHDGKNLYINNPQHTPWYNWKGKTWCQEHPFGHGCNSFMLEFDERANLYYQFINKKYEPFKWDF